MELDLTRLNQLHYADFESKKSNEEAPEQPQETLIANGDSNTFIADKSPQTAKKDAPEGLRLLQRKADEHKEALVRSLAVYKKYQENIMISSQLQTEILKGAKAGESVYSLFLKACKALSLMTSNTLFYTQLETDIREIYGQGLLEAYPLQMELQTTKERIARLKEALERDIEPRARDRIQLSIKAHEAQKAELESLIQRSTTA